MAEIDPFRVLPEIFRRHVTAPFHVLRIWAVLLALLLGYFTVAGESRRPAAASAPAAHGVQPVARHTVRLWAEGVTLDIEVRGFEVSFRGDGVDGLKLEGARGSEARLRDAAGNTVFRYKPNDEGDKAKLYGPQGTVAYRIKDVEADSKLKLRDAAGAELYRVKVKGDSYNLYDGRGERIAKGKLKGGRYVLRSIAGDREMATIEGAGSLEEAAVLSIPVAAAYRLLLWYAHGS